MAGFFQQALKGAATGFFNDAYLRDFKHASKTFTTNGFANAPKFKWLFHVYFDVNTSLINSGAFADPILPGLLVKSLTLPKFSPQVVEMNQYNRKRYVQTKINYDPVSITFHDDNAGAIKQLWYNYYSYYYNDTITAAQSKTAALINNTYSDDISRDQNWGYSGEPTSGPGPVAIGIPKPQFFNNIKIYGFNQHNFSCYTLINPIIERFEHDTYDYYQTNATMENRMTIRYETVTYQEGAINGERPDEKIPSFGTDQYYDRTLSPISQPGGNKTIMGQGGLVDAGSGILSDLASANFGGALAKGLNVANTWKNPSQILTAAKSELVAGALAAASNPAVGRAAFNFAAQGASRAGAAIQSASTNIKNTFAPPAPPDP